MSVRLRSFPLVVLVVALALVVGGCGLSHGSSAGSQSHSTRTSGTPLSGAAATASPVAGGGGTVVGPGTTTTAEAEQALAGVGVGTVASASSHRPLVPVTGPVVSSLLQSQVGLLAAQASAGGGTLGSDLDAAFPLGDGAPTLTEIVGAWVASAADPAAQTAAHLMGTVDWTTPAEVVLPTEVLDLFVADLTQSVATARDASASSTLGSAGSGAGGGGGGGATPSLDTPCTSLASFVSDQIASIFRQLRIDPQQVQDYISGHVGGFVGTLLGWLGRVGVSVVNGLVDILHTTVDQVVSTFTTVVVSRLQVVLGSVYAVLQIINLVRPHTVQVTASPTVNELSVGAEPDHVGSFTASVPDNDETAGLPSQMVDCATFAHVHPPTVTRPGATVQWQVLDDPQTVEVTSPSGHGTTYDDLMGPDVTSTLRYRTLREASRTGQEYVAPVEAAVSVQRTEVKDLRDMLDAALGANLGLLAPFAQAIIHPLLDQIESKLPLVRIEGHQVIGVRYWGGQPPAASTPDCPAGATIGAGTYVAHVHALLGTHELVTLKGQRFLAAQAQNLMTGTVSLT